jgi:hypothetical protein
MTLKLYVWTGIWTDYTDGLAFAIAESVEEAMRLVIMTYFGENDPTYPDKPFYRDGSNPEYTNFVESQNDFNKATLHIHELTEKVAYGIGGGG